MDKVIVIFWNQSCHFANIFAEKIGEKNAASYAEQVFVTFVFEKIAILKQNWTKSPKIVNLLTPVSQFRHLNLHSL
jgi:hypothetical protein